MPPQDSSEHDQEKIERLRRAMYSRSLSQHIKDRPRRELHESDSIVGDEFTPSEDNLPSTTVAPRMINLARTILWWLLGIAIVFFVGAGGFFAYYFTLGSGSSNATSQNIDITISGPQQIQSGEPAELQVVVQNHNNVPLNLAELVITFPSGTRSASDYTKNFLTDTIDLGTIGPGGQVRGTERVVFEGVQGKPLDVKAELEYHIGGSSAIFVASSDYSVTFGSSPLSISVDGNNETISGQPVLFTVNVASNAESPLSGVIVRGTFPFGFKFSSSDVPQGAPAPLLASDGSGAVWQLGDFSPGQQKSITLQGSMSGQEGDQRMFHFVAGTATSSAATSSIAATLADETFSMTVTKPFFGLAVSVNGGSGKVVSVSPGDSVTVSINWQNNLQTAITDGIVVARLSGFEIDGTMVKSTNGFFRSTDDSMLWNKSTDPQLATVAPGAHGTVSFSFQVPGVDMLKNIVNPTLDISINAAGNRLSESGVPETLQAATDQKIALASQVNLVAQALYYTNPFGSQGPMPPKAGTETTYAILLNVINTTSKITKASVVATLPPYVRWTGVYLPNTENVYISGQRSENGQIVTPPPGDPCQGVPDICWSLGDVAPGVGLNGTPARQAVISIGFTPSTSQIGQQPVLVSNIRLIGIDSAKASALKASNPGAVIAPETLGVAHPDVTTNLVQVSQSASNSGTTYAGDAGFTAANATVVK